MSRVRFVVKFRDLFSIANFFYKTIGIRPVFHDILPKVSWTIFFWLSFWNLFIAYVGEWLYVFTSIGEFSSFLQLTALAPCIGFVTMALNHMMLVHRHRKLVVGTITMLEQQFPTTLADQEAQQIVEKKRELDRFLFGFSGVFVLFITTLNYISLIAALVNYFKVGVFEKQLPYFIWYPFNAFDDRWYNYMYLHQSWAGFTTIFAMLAELFLIGTTVLQFCIQFERIAISIREYRPNKETNQQFLSRTIAQHSFILDRADEFVNIISATLFLHYMLSSMIICFAGFQVMAGEDVYDKFKFILFLFCSLIQTIIVGKFGNDMMDYVSFIVVHLHNIMFERCVMF